MLIDTRPLRRSRDFRLLFTGQLVSFCGSMISYVAVPYQVYQLTKSSFLVGLLGAVQLAPLLLSALFGGAFADSLDRRKLLIYSEVAMTAATAMLAVNALLPAPSVTAIFLLSGILSAVNGFHRPALDSLTPRLVERDEFNAVSALRQLSHSFGTIVSPAVAGLVIAQFGLVMTYFIDVATFFVSLMALAMIRSMPEHNAEKKADAPANPLGQIGEGLRYAFSRPELIGTYIVDIIAMLFAMPMALFPAMAENWGGAKAAGALYGAMSIGTVVLTLFSGWTNRVKRHGAAVIVSATLWGAAIVALGFAQSLWVAVACLALAGAADSASAIYRFVIWNETIPNELRGRLAGIEMLSYMSGPLLGNLRAGFVASLFGNPFSIISGGVACVIGVLLCIPLLPAFWRYRTEIVASPAK